MFLEADFWRRQVWAQGGSGTISPYYLYQQREPGILVLYLLDCHLHSLDTPKIKGGQFNVKRGADWYVSMWPQRSDDMQW